MSEWSDSQKIFILSKSNKRCSHCGKRLSIHSMTVEHVIPLSWDTIPKKHMPNLVALCWDCNNIRGNDEVFIDDYYKYLTDDTREELRDFIARYKNGKYYYMLA